MMYAWGSSAHGELGIDGVDGALEPIELPWAHTSVLVDAACGDNHSLLVTDDGKVYSCGSNDNGQLGHGQPRKRPQEVSGLQAYEITGVACGSAHSMALNHWGQVFAWGSDSHGQLGHNMDNTQQQATPKIVKALATHHVVQIACGQRHSVALTNSGDIFTWGANNHGQLGRGTTTPFEANPAPVTSLTGIPIAYICCGANHTFAISKSSAVFCWGKNLSGQLGLNDNLSKSYPCQLRMMRTIRVRYIACGDDFSTFLTMEGGVFTCGAGAYGQLGHGNSADEILPRQIVELMGSTITQVQCGRQHTLAYVPSQTRIYSFGLGTSGQLGSKDTANNSTPQVVLGPWTPQKQEIHRIFAGGDHCFATLRRDNVEFDARSPTARGQILSINYEALQGCLHLLPTARVDQDTLTYLETVFKSLACLNGSFLLDGEENNYPCSSKYHGVNFELVEKTFSLIGQLENQTIKDVIWHCITDDIMTKFTPSPPDVEALRAFLTLPYYHEFNNPKQHLKLHKPFAQAILLLRTQACRVLGEWWNRSPIDYFEKLVLIYKSVAAYLIRNQRVPQNKTVVHDESLEAMLNMLALLSRLNHNVDGLKVPYDTFHINDLTECVDIRVDYVAWLSDNSHGFFLCNYPFIFDAHVKIQLLETDQSIQMQSAMHNAFQQALMTSFLSVANITPMQQFLVLNVSRDNLVDDSLRELSAVHSNDLKKPLKVKFHGEEAEDAGGVSKEFFMLLMREILDPKYGMFKEYDETHTVWFSEDSFEHELMYFLIGLICGLAIYNFTIIDIPFPLAMYKKLLNEKVGLADLRGLSPTIASSLQSLLDYDGDDVEDVFMLSFQISRDSYGETVSKALKPDGEHIPVTSQNKKEYVDLYVDYILNSSVRAHYDAFCNGFMKVCGGRVLELFHAHELMAVVVGNENYDWHALEEAALYRNGYRSSDVVIRWFWEVLHDMSLTDKKKFLLFLTGSNRIPLQGMKAIKIIIQPTTDDKYLPVAHTCFNLLDLPRYRTKERLKYKLLQAIQQTEGFSLV